MEAAIVLAGGAARRMGGLDKAALRVGKVTLLENVLAAAAPLCSSLVVVGPVRPTCLPRVVFTIESKPGGGPVPAVFAGLAEAGGADAVFVLAADLALLSTSGLQQLLDVLSESDAGAAAAADENGNPNPLLAVYRTTVVRRAIERLGPNLRGIAASRLLPEDTVVVPMDSYETLNVNTPDDLSTARGQAVARKGPRILRRSIGLLPYPAIMSRRTKIVATIGPASDSSESLTSLIDAGVDVVRLGFAHGTTAQHLQTLARVRAAAAGCGRIVGVLADLPGPKVRTGPFPEGGTLLLVGGYVRLIPGEGASHAETVSVDYPSLLADLSPGDRIALGDGAVVLGVEKVTEAGAIALVHNGGWLKGRPGVHLPAERIRVSSPTAADLDLLVAIRAEVDMVAISFVQNASDIQRARAAAGPNGPMIVAKIETRAAVDNLNEIIDVADAVMIARGDLGVECPIEEVPHLQKHIIRTCVAWGRPVITATQMLESMVSAPTPTRAEASDIANAVFDGADALMLSAETAIGHDPVGAVLTMARIATRAEKEADYVQWGGRLGKLQRLEQLPGSLAISAATSMAAWQLALSVEAAAILCCTRSGATARAIARFRPTAPLVGLCPVPATARQLTLTWGLLPVMVPEHGTTDDIVWFAVEHAVKIGLVRKGQTVVVLAGNPADPDPVSDDVRVVRIR